MRTHWISQVYRRCLCWAVGRSLLLGWSVGRTHSLLWLTSLSPATLAALALALALALAYRNLMLRDWDEPDKGTKAP